MIGWLCRLCLDTMQTSYPAKVYPADSNTHPPVVWEIPYKWRFLAGEIIELNGGFSIATFDFRRKLIVGRNHLEKRFEVDSSTFECDFGLCEHHPNDWKSHMFRSGASPLKKPRPKATRLAPSLTSCFNAWNPCPSTEALPSSSAWRSAICRL